MSDDHPRQPKSLARGPGGPPALPHRPAAPGSDEAEEISADEIQEAEDTQTGVSLDLADSGPSTLDPWFAQLVHGYCPPEGALFARHPPPTTFPGRETEGPSSTPRKP